MATTYITPTGTGDKSGSNWNNAAAIGSLDAMAKKAGAGGTVLLAANKGTYNVSGPIGLSTGSVTIKGVNTDGTAAEAHFEGSRAHYWTAGATTGNELFRILKGADNVTFENMQINNTGTAIRVGGDVKNLTIQNMDVNNVQRFLEDYASGTNKTATISGLTVKDVDVVGFSKDAIRLQYDTNNVLVQDVVGDSAHQTGDNFAMGVHLEDTVHNVTFRRVTMENSATVNGSSSDYWQGDGFASERGTYNLNFEDTVSRGNTDGGYDLKSDNVTMSRALAEDNGRNFRIWGSNVTISDSVGLDPHRRGGITTQSQLWVDTGAKNVKVIDSTFSDSGSSTRAIVNGGDLTMTGTTLTLAITATAIIGTKPTGYAGDTIKTVAATGLNSAGTVYADGTLITDAPIPITVTAPSATPTTAADTASVASGDWLHLFSTTGNDTFVATGKAEMFVFDQSAKIGNDTIKNFGPNDFVVFREKLGDANNDGVTTFGSNGKLDFANGSSISFNGTVKGLRCVGETSDGYVYGDYSVWKAGSAMPAIKEAAAYVSTSANETYIATNARETFVFDIGSGKQGTDTIRGFGSNDVLVTSRALADGNKDGLISPGNGGFDLGDHSSLVKLPDLSKAGLRYLGTTEEGYLYGDAAVRPKGAIEGKLTVADTLVGGNTDTATDKFFFDTALDRSLGADKVTNFGAKDVIVTTASVGSGAAGSHIDAVGGVFSLGHDGLDLGSVAVTDVSGHAVTSLEFDGDTVLNGTHYYVYSTVGSAIGTDILG